MADLYTLFENVSQARAEEAVSKFIQMDRPAGDVLIEEGEVHDSMLLVEAGEVTIIAGGFEVARMGVGSVIGEIGLFTHAVRTATVRAATPVTVQILSRKAFMELRNGGNPIAFRIERRAFDAASCAGARRVLRASGHPGARAHGAGAALGVRVRRSHP
jgi:CRP/FNR family cyclic AMP-dependent transcriptional regulator